MALSDPASIAICIVEPKLAPYSAVLSIALYYIYSNIALPQRALIRMDVRYLETILNPCTNIWGGGVSLI